MPDPFRLPKLKTLDRIVDKLGRPSVAFLKFLNTDFAGAIERNEAAQAATDLALQAQIDRLTAVLAGTEEFTAVNVGGTIVAEDAGLADDIVTTPSVLAGQVTPYFSAYTTGTVVWAASSAEKDLQTVSSVVVTRGAVIIQASVSVDIDAFSLPTYTGILRLYRDGVEISAAQVTQVYQAEVAAGRLFARQWSLNYIESPGAGTYTYKITFDPGHTATGELRRRFLSILPLEG